MQLHSGLSSDSTASVSDTVSGPWPQPQPESSNQSLPLDRKVREYSGEYRTFRISISVYLWFPVQFSVLTRIIEQRGCGKRESCALHTTLTSSDLSFSPPGFTFVQSAACGNSTIMKLCVVATELRKIVISSH